VVVEDTPSAPAPARRPRPRRLALVAVVVLGLALGLGIDVARVGGVDAWLAARGPARIDPAVPPYEALGRVIDIGGRGVYLDCRGIGSPTVILESGFAGSSGGWGYVLDGIAGFTRVCAWDRPGLGRSDPRGLHSGGEVADDLRTALHGAGERGPFVVVAHSLGGVYARLFASSGPATGPESVMALVMLDTYEPDLGLANDPTLGADVRAAAQQSIDGTGAMIHDAEDLDWTATLEELARVGPVQLPTILLVVDPKLRYVNPDPAVAAALLAAFHRGIAARYPNGRLEVAPDSGHLIQFDRPDLVLERTRELVLRYRNP
jgi:pimeloyl-ACP methyl ester carboxylesterase